MNSGSRHLALCQLALCFYVSSTVLLTSVATRVAAGQACVDEDPLCEHWSNIAECVANPYFMRKACAKSCQAEPVCALRPLWPIEWPGYATEAGTRLYALQGPGVAGKAHPDFFRRDVSMGSYLLPNQKVRGPDWLMLGSLGSGTYLGNEDEETDEMVACGVIAGIGHGWNVIDTASNYRNGRAELAVGRALRAVRASPFIERHMLFVSTKAGFVPEHLLKGLLSAGKIQDSDVAAGGHCIHPACLQASLTQSLTSLSLETVDLLYLHNAAEMQLGPLGKQGFRQALGEGFRALEELRREGRIRAYGMATWDCFRLPPSSPSHLSLQDVIVLAREIGGIDHGFRYVQLPINAAMPEAWKEKWQSMPTRMLHDDGRLDEAAAEGVAMGTLMETAATLGVGVFASGPLQEGQLLGNRQLQDLVQRVPKLAEEEEFASQLLQIARSTPLLTASLVGMKTRDHVDANLKLTAHAPLNSSLFASLHQQWDVSAV